MVVGKMGCVDFEEKESEKETEQANSFGVVENEICFWSLHLYPSSYHFIATLLGLIFFYVCGSILLTYDLE